MTQNRKRGRNHLVEDEVEFMPLSKRINNLHINSMLLDGAGSIEWGPGPPPAAYMEHHGGNSSGGGITPDSPPQSIPSHQQYTPDLSESQNPHYFSINKLLFEMYLQRLHRGGCDNAC